MTGTKKNKLFPSKYMSNNGLVFLIFLILALAELLCGDDDYPLVQVAAVQGAQEEKKKTTENNICPSR